MITPEFTDAEGHQIRLALRQRLSFLNLMEWQQPIYNQGGRVTAQRHLCESALVQMESYVGQP